MTVRSLWTRHEARSPLTAIFMLPCFHHDLYHTLCPRFAFSTVLETTPNAHRLPLLSHLLRSAWYSLVPNCWIVPRNLWWGVPVPSVGFCFVFSGIQFTKHTIEVFFGNTNKLVRSNLNMILTQTCDRRSTRVAISQRWALAFYFTIRIWHVFWISISRAKSDLGLCMTSVLAQGMRLHSADFWFKTVFGFKIHRKSGGTAQPHSFYMYWSHAQT